MFETEKNRILDFCKENKNKKIYIYGAGRVAKPLAKMILENDYNVEGFAVTDTNDNRDSEMGLPIVGINDIEVANDIAFIIGVKHILNDEITDVLHKKGFFNILPATEMTRNISGYGNYFYNTPMLEITTQIGCGINCKFCPQDVFVKEYTKNSKEYKLTYEAFVSCMRRCPEDILIVFAGFTEPFYNKDCLRMIQYSSEHGYKMNMFTTLVGLDKTSFQELLNYEFEEFVLHLPDEEGFSNIPITEEYLQMIDELVNRKKRNGDSYVTYVCSQGKVPQIVREHIGKELRIYVSLTDRAGNLTESENLYSKSNIKGKIKCSLSKELNHNVLLPNGDVLLCAQDWGMKHVLGNLVNQTFEEIRDGIICQELNKKMQQEDDDSILCRNCCHAIEI